MSFQIENNKFVDVYFILSWGHNDETTSIKILHETSLKVMDLAYLRRNIVYEKLFQVATGESTGYQEDR